MSQTKNKDSERPGKDKKTILFVEDHKSQLYYHSRMAENRGYNTITASNGAKALELFRMNKPDLVVTDIIMPGMDGIELIGHLRKIDPLVPIITFSAYGDGMERDLAHGADAYLSKLGSMDEVFEEISALLSKPPVELENNRLKAYSSFLASENARLREQLEAVKSKKETETAEVDAEKHHAIYAAIAHDMANEFVLIGVALRQMRKRAADSVEIQEAYDVMERSLHYVGQLLRRLKNYSEIARPHLEPVKISKLVKGVESLIRPRIPSNILFEIEADPDALEGTVFVDAEQVIGALTEITNNAVHALRNSEEGVIKLNFSVRDGRLMIAISNNGPGIPEDIRETLFRRQVRSSRETGTGVGLFLANRALNTLGGTISLGESSPDGVTFTIQFPLYEHQKDE